MVARTSTTEVQSAKKSSFALTADMPIADIVALCPEGEKILATWGLHCVGCGGMAFETLRNGAMSHGFSDADVEEIVDDLKRAWEEGPSRPQTLTVTAAAAEGFKSIAENDGKADHVLVVKVDGAGGFCMEFSKDIPEDGLEFTNPDVPSMRIFASPTTLHRIGGAVIDVRDGRFKLDLAEDKTATHGCACGGKCDCRS